MVVEVGEERLHVLDAAVGCILHVAADDDCRASVVFHAGKCVERNLRVKSAYHLAVILCGFALAERWVADDGIVLLTALKRYGGILLRHLGIILLHSSVVGGICLLLRLDHLRGRTFQRGGFLGRCFLLQRFECLVGLLQLRIYYNSGAGFVAACHLVECVEGGFPIGTLKHGFACLFIYGNTRQGSRLAVGFLCLALLLLLQHLLVVLLHSLHLLFGQSDTAITLRGFIESTLCIDVAVLVFLGGVPGNGSHGELTPGEYIVSLGSRTLTNT